MLACPEHRNQDPTPCLEAGVYGFPSPLTPPPPPVKLASVRKAAEVRLGVGEPGLVIHKARGSW